MTTKITNANITNTGVSAGSYTNTNLTVNAQGQITAASNGTGGGGTPGGSDTQVQFNDAGSFGGDAGLTYNKTTDTLTTSVVVHGAGTASAPSITTTGDTNTGVYFSAADEISFATGGSQRAKIGTADLTITNGNLVIGTSGKGIDFSATSGTGTSELLADYEEGTWTPTLTTSGTNFTSVTYNAVTSGKYRKIGSMVYVQGVLHTTAVTKGSASGFPMIGGLPFSKANDGQHGMFAAMQRSGWSTNVQSTGAIENNGSRIYLLYITSANGATSYAAVSDISTTDNIIYFGACYVAA